MLVFPLSPTLSPGLKTAIPNETMRKKFATIFFEIHKHDAEMQYKQRMKPIEVGAMFDNEYTTAELNPPAAFVFVSMVAGSVGGNVFLTSSLLSMPEYRKLVTDLLAAHLLRDLKKPIQ